jgi:hypothetical protein
MSVCLSVFVSVCLSACLFISLFDLYDLFVCLFLSTGSVRKMRKIERRGPSSIAMLYRPLKIPTPKNTQFAREKQTTSWLEITVPSPRDIRGLSSDVNCNELLDKQTDPVALITELQNAKRY